MVWIVITILMHLACERDSRALVLAHAAVCFQADGSSNLTVGIRFAIATLVVISSGVLTAIGVFTIRFIRRGGW